MVGSTPDNVDGSWQTMNRVHIYLIMNFNKRATAAAAAVTAAKCLMFDEMNFWPLKKIISTLWSNVWLLLLQLDGSWCRRFQLKKCSISGQPHNVMEDYFLVVVGGEKERIISSQNTSRFIAFHVILTDKSNWSAWDDNILFSWRCARRMNLRDIFSLQEMLTYNATRERKGGEKLHSKSLIEFDIRQ